MDRPPNPDDSDGEESNERILQRIRAYEDEHNLHQEHIFVLEGLLNEMRKKLKQCKEQESLRSQGLKKIVEERELFRTQWDYVWNQYQEFQEEYKSCESRKKRMKDCCNNLAAENKRLSEIPTGKSAGKDKAVITDSSPTDESEFNFRPLGQLQLKGEEGEFDYDGGVKKRVRL